MKQISVIGIACVLFCALVYGALAQQRTNGTQSLSSAATLPQRYVLIMRDGVRADTFLLDTETGKIWSRVKITDVPEQPDIWRFEERVDSPEQFAAWSTRQFSPRPK